MLVSLALLSLVALSATNAETTFEIMDTQAPALEGVACNSLCPTLMNFGLSGAGKALDKLMKVITFKTGFCNCNLTGLGNFKYSESCSANADTTVFDHKVTATFINPTAYCTCNLPNNPSGAAEQMNNSPTPVGKCGKDELGDKLPPPTFKCDSDNSDSTPGPIKLKGDFKEPKLELTLRVDTRGPEHIFPTKVKFITQDDSPISVEDSPGFEKAWECIYNGDNKQAFYRKMVLNAFKPVFECLDENNEHTRSVVDTILYFGGNCNNYPNLG